MRVSIAVDISLLDLFHGSHLAFCVSYQVVEMLQVHNEVVLPILLWIEEGVCEEPFVPWIYLYGFLKEYPLYLWCRCSLLHF